MKESIAFKAHCQAQQPDIVIPYWHL